MPRKNRNRRSPQARRRQDGTHGVRSSHQAPPVETLVVPNGRCFRNSRKGKLRFTKDVVEKALRQAQASRKARGTTYAENRYYECLVAEGGCGDFHLTSRETYTPRSNA